MQIHGRRGALAAILVMTIAGTALADPAADRCGADKMKSLGRYAQGLLACNAAATRSGGAVDPACEAKAAGKLEAAFAKSEGGGACATAGDAATVESTTAGDVNDVVTALAPAANDAARKCAATKMKGVSKYHRSRLGCYVGGALVGGGPSANCFAAAYAKLVPVFSKAESRGGCTTAGDLAAIDGLASTAVRDEVRLLSPVCGDGITGPGQQCETGDDAACPGLCSPACACVSPPDCGNGVAELPEECDDGNNDDLDGCSRYCLLESASALCRGVPTTAGTALNAVLLNSGFQQPIHATAPPLDPSRLFVVEREGRIRILDLKFNTIAPVPFLDITSLTTTDGERGLLSMAFDPAYASNRRFYVYYTNTSGNLVIARYETMSGAPNLADASSAKILLTIAHPTFSNHDGGQLAFGADGDLYIGTGDGGGGGDPFANAQNDTKLLGKILRMDVAVDTAPYWAVPPGNPHYVDGTNEPELIWAKGVRNPWRFSFDRSTGDLLIADVGQDAVEEIDFQAAASTGGENYGWRIFEGDTCYDPSPAPVCPAPPTGFTMPIHEYTHVDGCAIVGGFVYRGCAMPDLAANYFYSDNCASFVRTIGISAGVAVNPQDRTGDVTSTGASFGSIGSFGEDARGEIYIVDLSGPVYRLEPE